MNKKLKKRNILNKRETNYPEVVEDRRYNSHVLQSGRNSINCEKDIPLGISIIDCNVHEREEALIDYIFRLSSKYIYSFVHRYGKTCQKRG